MHDVLKQTESSPIPATSQPRRPAAQSLSGMLRFSAVTLFCGAILLGTARRSSAATITVTNTSDSGVGSLRAAIAQANIDPPGDIINFNLPFRSTISLTTELVLTNTMSITGAVPNSLAIDAVSTRAFKITSPAAVTLSTVVVYGSYTGFSGGAIYLASGASLTAQNAIISGRATNGGGIFSKGNLTLKNSTLSRCVATANGGAVYAQSGTTLISDCTISGTNSAVKGGGVYVNAPVTIENSTISGNTASTNGGGIYAHTSVLTVRNSTIANNSSTNDGGGLCLSGSTPAVTLQSTIVSDNTGAAGADIFNASGSTLNVDHSLLSVAPSAAINGTNTNNSIGVSANLGSLQRNGGPTATQKPNAGSPALGAGSNPAGLTTDQRGAPRPLAGSVDIGAVQLQPAKSLVVTNANDSGPGSLRAAASTVVDAPSTITFDPVVFATPQIIALTTGEISIQGPFTISGPGAANLTVDAKGASGVLNVYQPFGSYVTISGITVANGAQTVGAGIYSSFTDLSLDSVVISGCNASSASFGVGGGIFSYGYLTLKNVTISGCSAIGPGGFGGGLYSRNLNAQNSKFTGNTTISNNSVGPVPFNGGGILCRTAVLSNCTISGNSAISSGGNNSSAAGGGLSVFGSAQIVNSTISGNKVQASNGSNSVFASGGGIYSLGQLSVQNSTISNNSVKADGMNVSQFAEVYGGGIYAQGAVYLYNSTVLNNTASAVGSLNGDSAYGGGSYVAGNGASQLLKSVIVAKNSPDDLGGNIDTSSSNNLIGIDTNVMGISNGALGNQIGSGTPLDPLLGPLQNNGGITQTHAVLNGSPAIAAGVNTVDILSLSNAMLTTDQRGANFPRTRAGNVVDIGAIQLDQTAPIARLGSAPDVTNASNPNQYTFTVIFSDNAAIDPASLGNANVLVTGPNGFSQLAAFINAVPAIPGSPLTATYQINAPGGSWQSNANGTYTLAVLANQVKDTSGNPVAAATLGTFKVAVLTIISPPIATPNPATPGQPVVFNAGAASSTDVTYIWNFGDGTSANGSTVSHIFGVPKIYTVTLTVIDANGQSVTTTFVLPVNAGVKTAFKLKRFKISLNFAQVNEDQILLSGILPLPPGYNPSGQTLSVDIGHVIRSYKLDATGNTINSIDPNLQPLSANDTFKLKPGKSARQFTLQIGFGSFQAALNSETDPAQDLPPNPGKVRTRKVRATIYINNAVYEVLSTQRYTVKHSIGTFGH